jgi:hypothetical protein
MFACITAVLVAGKTPVHINSGTACLALACYLSDEATERRDPFTVVIVSSHLSCCIDFDAAKARATWRRRNIVKSCKEDRKKRQT